jgi:signal transduction histidine kinase
MADADGPENTHVSLEPLMSLLMLRSSGMLTTQDRLRSLVQANRSIVSELSLPGVLRRIVEAARDVARAQYAALCVLGPDGGLDQFVHVGMDDETVARISELPQARGILGTLMDNPAPIRLNDLTRDPRHIGFPDGHSPMRSFLGVPIQVPGAVFGFLCLTEREGGEFTPEDEELVLAMAATAGIAIENARLYEESRQRQEWLRARAEVARNLSTADASDNLQRIAESVLRLASADVVSVVRPEPDTGMVKVVAAIGVGADDLLNARYERAGSLAGAAMERRSGLIFDRTDSYVETTICPVYADCLGAVMALPLVAEHGTAGAVVVGRHRGGRPFTESDLEMADSFAGQAAVAMELAEARVDQERLALLQDRDRIARDLHDHVIQRLFAIGLSLQSVAAGHPDSRSGARLVEIVGDVDTTIQQIRTVIFALRDSADPSNSGLRSSVLSVVATAASTLPHRPDVLFDGPLDTVVDHELISDVEAVAREALSNVARHARAQHTEVRVAVDDHDLEVRISDDGCGISGLGRRSGLENLRRRAQRYGGELKINSSVSTGTTLSWTVPIARGTG